MKRRSATTKQPRPQRAQIPTLSATDASEALTLALFDRVPAVAGATLEAYAANGNAPAAVRAIHRAAPGLLALLPEIVRNGIDADLTQRLLDWASMPIGDRMTAASPLS